MGIIVYPFVKMSLIPIGDVSTDILVDLDDQICSTTSGMHSKKVSKLLSYPGVHSRRYCRFEREEVVRSRSLPLPITELGSMHLCDNLNETCCLVIVIG